jgi:hypothetical protein
MSSGEGGGHPFPLSLQSVCRVQRGAVPHGPPIRINSGADWLMQEDLQQPDVFGPSVRKDAAPGQNANLLSSISIVYSHKALPEQHLHHC